MFKNKTISIRVTKEDKEKMIKLAKKARRSITQYILRKCLD